MIWKLAEAKNRLSEVVNLALEKGPQHIVRRGDELILMSRRDFEKLNGDRESLVDYLQRKVGLDKLDISRDLSAERSVEL